MSVAASEDVIEAAAARGRPPGRQAAFGFIFATAVMNAVSFGLMIPVLPNLVRAFVGGDTASAALWTMVFAASWGLVQFMCGPVLGQLSDRFGRRPVLLISIFGLGVDFLFMAFAPTLGWLFVGRILNGMTASSFSTANAYVADVTAPEDRARRFGLMGSAFTIGLMLGPVMGGVLADINLRLPFMVAAALSLLNGLYGVFILPESLPKARRLQSFRWRSANPVGSLSFLRGHGELFSLAGMSFLFQFSQNMWPSVYVLYAGYRYHWSIGFIGAVMAVSSLAGVGVQVGLVGPVVRRFGERGALIAGAFAGAISMTIYGWAPNGWVYFVGMPFGVASGLMLPGLMGLMSRAVAANEQGRMQGANQSLQGIAAVIGPLVYAPIFAWSVRHDASLHQPGLALYISGAAIFAIFLLSMRIAPPPARAAA
jgi:DHA1 family tetracycline resistance protein-like MFS transporter